MNPVAAAISAELLKARRSLVPWLAAASLSLGPCMAGLFMYVLADPERARRMGLVGTKARLAAGAADWPAFLGLIAQVMAAGGLIVIGIVTAWIFGRELVDRTIRNILAVPTPRAAIVTAKLAVVALYGVLVTAWLAALALGIGALVGVAGASTAVIVAGLVRLAEVAALVIVLQTVPAWIASFGRGYLAPVGVTFGCVVVANVSAMLGYGRWFPWAVPGLLSGAAGPDGEQVGVASVVLVVVTGSLGGLATLRWWTRADQAG